MQVRRVSTIHALIPKIHLKKLIEGGKTVQDTEFVRLSEIEGRWRSSLTTNSGNDIALLLLCLLDVLDFS